MLRIKVEMIPNGRRARAQTLGIMEIQNESWGDDRWPVEADYAIKAVTELGGGEVAVSQRMVFGHERLRWNVWGLLLKAIESLGTDALEFRGDEHALGA